MNRAGWWLIPVVLVTLLVGGGVGAAIAAHHHGDRTIEIRTTTTGAQPGEPGQVIRVERDGWHHGWGFFPGFLLFPLLWIGVIWLIFGAFGRRGGRWGRWDDHIEDWHRKQHQDANQGPTPPGSNA